MSAIESNRKCIYCPETKNMSKEHIFPDFLLQRVNMKSYLHANVNNQDFPNPKGQTIKQVCESCNNGPLSRLDSLAKDFFQKNNLFDRGC